MEKVAPCVQVDEGGRALASQIALDRGGGSIYFMREKAPLREKA
jgi:hypothetical protein